MHAHATYNLQFIHKMWYSTAPFLADFGGLGTVKKALIGRDVQEDVTLHKKLYEALSYNRRSNILMYLNVTSEM